MTYTAYYDELYFSAREAWRSTDYEHLKGMFSRTLDTADYQTPVKQGKRFDFDQGLSSTAARSAPRSQVYCRGGTNGKQFQVPVLSTMLAMVLFTGFSLTMPLTTSAQRFGEGAQMFNRLLAGYRGYGGASPHDHSRMSRTKQYTLLSDVQTLTFSTRGQMTTARRSYPAPQATCIGGTAQGQYTPASIQCTNKGWDGIDTQWECKADLDNAYRFGETTVVCEGRDHGGLRSYDYPNDSYILTGSCSVEYTLELTQEGRDIQNAKISQQAVGTGAGAGVGAWLGGHNAGSYRSNNAGGYPDWGPPPSDSRWNMYNNNNHHHHRRHHQRQHHSAYNSNPTCYHQPHYTSTGYNGCGSNNNGHRSYNYGEQQRRVYSSY